MGGDAGLATLIARIVAAADPVAIHLFGSRARGGHDEESDYDLFVVVDDDFPQPANPITGHAMVRGSGVPADVLVVRASAFALNRDEVGTMSYEASHHGRVVYERSPRPALVGTGR
jgi:uncharacterized protein